MTKELKKITTLDYFELLRKLKRQGEPMKKNDNFKYEIKKQIVVLSETPTETKELNLISFNDAPPTYDLRKWGKNANGTKTMYRGITLKIDELKELKKTLNSIKEI